MKITKNIVPSIAYQVRTQDGVLVDEAPVNQPLEYLHGHNNLVVGLENALEGKAVGDTFEVRVKPEEGYGEYNDNMVQRVPKDVFMGVDELEVGMRFIADTDIGPLPVVITEIDGDEVVVDGNHMLAGQELLFSVEVVATREATLEEIAHGHIHGEHDECGCGDHDHDSCGCGGHHHHHHHHDGCCGGHHHEEAHEGCCEEHHHHHHNGVCCDEHHHHHHSADETCPNK
jgi:FKBP-type peptidyl-prolyl cis-trans isomerase SlyD